MSLIVQKFGGTSVANAERLFNVANIVTQTYKQGNDVVVVVSAQGDTTDDLIAKANEINPNASKREMDMLLTSGEQISASLLAMAIEKLGFPVPITVWLKEDKYYEKVKKAFESEAARKFFNTDELVKMLDAHKSGKLDNSKKIWVVYMFLVWYDVYFVQEKVSFV